MKFEIGKNDLKVFYEWHDNHFCQYKKPPDEEQPYLGAIGGGLTFSFTPISIGTLASAKCSCGEEVLLAEDI